MCAQGVAELVSLLMLNDLEGIYRDIPDYADSFGVERLGDIQLKEDSVVDWRSVFIQVKTSSNQL